MISPSERQSLREQHFQEKWTEFEGQPLLNDWCELDNEPWPCLTIKLLDSLDELEAENKELVEVWAQQIAGNAAYKAKELDAARKVVESQANELSSIRLRLVKLQAIEQAARNFTTFSRPLNLGGLLNPANSSLVEAVDAYDALSGPIQTEVVDQNDGSVQKVVGQ